MAEKVVDYEVAVFSSTATSVIYPPEIIWKIQKNNFKLFVMALD
jgi:hypothetical protein